MRPRNPVSLGVRVAVFVAFGMLFLSSASPTAVAGETLADEKPSIGKFMPYIIGGSVALGVAAIVVLVNVAKQAERKANPLAHALPTDMQTEGNPLSRLAVPLLVAGGIAAGLFLIFHEVDNGLDVVKQAVNNPTPAVPQPQPSMPTVDPKVVQPIFQVPQVKVEVPTPTVQAPQPPRVPGTR